MNTLTCPECGHVHTAEWSNSASACMDMCGHDATDDNGGGCPCTQPIEVALMAQANATQERIAAALEDSARAQWASVYVAVLQSPEMLQRGDEGMLGEIETIAIRALLTVKAQQTIPSARAAHGGDADARP